MRHHLPILVMEKILKETRLRVSEDAKVELRNVLESKVKDISKKAIEYAEHAGRKTVRAEDIELAIKTMK